MANISGETGYLYTSNYSNSVCKLGTYNFGASTYGYPYYHFKTNVTTSYIMVRVDAMGLAYGAQQPVNCSWVFYIYGDGSVYNVGLTTKWSGLQPQGVYMSADGYACFYGYANGGNGGDMGFTLNSICPCPTGHGFDVQIQAAAISTSAGAYW